MRKIPTLFARDEATGRRYVRDEVTPGCEWVLAGEGRATAKYDGACFLVRGARLLKRRSIKVAANQETQFPPEFEKVEFDEATQKWVGWVPVGDGPEDRLVRETWALDPKADGTYELVGPKINGNPHKLDGHWLLRHGTDDGLDEDGAPRAGATMPWAPRDFEGLQTFLTSDAFGETRYEGIVWWHPDGRMAKLKRKDFPK